MFYDAILNPNQTKSYQQNKIPPETVFEEEDVEKLVTNLLKEGKHRSWINVSPYGISEDKLIMEFTYNPTDWTDKVFIASHFPKEPFSLRGPALPLGWKEGDKIKLNEIKIEQPEQ